MKKRFKASYDSINEGDECNFSTLIGAKEKIHSLMGEHYKHYTTACIFEFNFIGRMSSQYYFSTTDEQWHSIPISVLNYGSWEKSLTPFKQITRFLLTIFGYKSKYDEEMEKLMNHIYNND